LIALIRGHWLWVTAWEWSVTSPY